MHDRCLLPTKNRVFLGLPRSLALSLFGLLKDKSQATKRVRVAGGGEPPVRSTPVWRGSSCSGRNSGKGLGWPIGSGHRFSCRSQGRWTFCLPRAGLDQVTEPNNSCPVANHGSSWPCIYVTRVCAPGYARGRAIYRTCWRAIHINSYFSSFVSFLIIHSDKLYSLRFPFCYFDRFEVEERVGRRLWQLPGNMNLETKRGRYWDVSFFLILKF